MTPYFEEPGISLFLGDCRELSAQLPVPDCIIADPPYESTSLAWDKWQYGWPAALQGKSLWCFGTLRMFMEHAQEFREGKWKLSQDVIWEKHNGSSFHADRFRRVHEQPAHFYRGSWAEIYKRVQITNDATKRTTRRQERPPHMGAIANSMYNSHAGGPRQMRSVIRCHSEHGRAYNETQKPVALIKPLLLYACPPGGLLLSPFCGSGSDLVAAKQLGIRAIGVDLREDQIEIAAQRLSQNVMDFSEVL